VVWFEFDRIFLTALRQRHCVGGGRVPVKKSAAALCGVGRHKIQNFLQRFPNKFRSILKIF